MTPSAGDTCYDLPLLEAMPGEMIQRLKKNLEEVSLIAIDPNPHNSLSDSQLIRSPLITAVASVKPLASSSLTVPEAL